MKKLKNTAMKISKLFLVAIMIFSQIGTSIKTVIAEVVPNYDIDVTLSSDYKLNFKAIIEDSEGNVIDSDYDDESEYIVLVNSKFIYADGTYSDSVLYDTNIEDDYDGEVVTGSVLKTGDTFNLDPIITNYNGTYVVSFIVYDIDGITVKYESDDLTIDIDSNDFGLVLDSTNLSEESSEIDENGNFTGTYNVENYDGGNSYLNLSIATGNLNPNGSYYVNDNAETSTLEEIEAMSFTVVDVDYSNELYGEYTYEGSITLTDADGNVIEYSYNITVNNGDSSDNDWILSNNDLGIEFYDDYAIIWGKLTDTDTLPTIEEVIEEFDYDVVVATVKDSEGNEISEENIQNEIQTGMIIELNSASKSISYQVIVIFDTNDDNIIDDTDVENVIDRALDLNDGFAFEGLFDEEVNYIAEYYEISEEEAYRIIYEEVIMTMHKAVENQNWDYEISEEVVDEISATLNNDNSLIRVGDTFNITLAVAGLSEDYINMLSGSINYDSSILELIGVSSDNNWLGNINFDTNKLIYVGDKVDSDSTLLTFTFKALSETDSTTISFIDGLFYEDYNQIELEDITTLVTIERALHTDNTLASLNSNIGSFDKDFNKDTTEYTLYVDSSVTGVRLSGVLNDEYASVSGLGTYALTGDTTCVNIVVTAEDGSSRTYNVKIVKVYKSSNNYLSSLTVEGYDIDFDKNTYVYNIKVGSDVTSLDLTAFAEDSSATVVIIGNENFVEGNNVVTIIVTAEDGSSRTYTINVEKEKASNEELDSKTTVIDMSEDEPKNNILEKIVIIILIILVVAGLLYLIFKKDEEEQDQNKKLKEMRKNK